MTRFKTWLGEGRHKIIFICCVCCLALFCLFVAVFAVRSRTPSREELILEFEQELRFSVCAQLERRVHGEYECLQTVQNDLVILLANRIPNLTYFSETENTDERWIYKLTLNSEDIMPLINETVFEFGENIIRVNGVCFEPNTSDGEAMMDSLLENMQSLFDYVKAELELREGPSDVAEYGIIRASGR